MAGRIHVVINKHCYIHNIEAVGLMALEIF